ncbi:MAG: hypothetical protein R2744_02505 [Bacteroidales bacterium]
MTQMTEMGKEGRSIICLPISAPEPPTIHRQVCRELLKVPSDNGNEKQALAWKRNA